MVTKQPLVIGISGKAGAGKTTLAALLVKKLKGAENMAFAEALKWRVKHDFNFTDEGVYGDLKDSICYLRDSTTGKFLRHRDVLIQVGAFYRSLDPLFWVRTCFDRIHGSSADVTFISDVRFQNEAQYITRSGGFMVRVERAYELLRHGPHETDVSETDLDKYPFDALVKANDIDELEKEATYLARRINAYLDGGKTF